MIIWILVLLLGSVVLGTMESQDGLGVRESSMSNQNWRCPFSFCPRFGANMRDDKALRDHVLVHLRRSQSECMSGRGLLELVQHLREQGRWLCGRCSKTYKVGSRCRNRDCGAMFAGSEGLPIYMPVGLDMPVTRELMILPDDSAVRDDISDIFKPVDEDSEIFKKLRCQWYLRTNRDY